MVIDLLELGLTTESTFAEIQAVLKSRKFYTKKEVDAAASGARKATLAEEAKKRDEALRNSGKLSKEELQEYKDLKKGKKFNDLKNHKVLKKLDEEDFELIVNANNLVNLDKEELETKVKEIEKKYATKFLNGIPKKTEVQPKVKGEEKDEKEEHNPEEYKGGNLGLFE